MLIRNSEILSTKNNEPTNQRTNQRTNEPTNQPTNQPTNESTKNQLIYKWAHARREIAATISESFRKLALSGWRPSMEEVVRDVQRLMGGAYEEFMAK